MKVAIVGELWSEVRGGIEFHAERLDETLRVRGHKVTRLRSLDKSRAAGYPTFDWVIFEGVHRRDLASHFLLNVVSAKRTALFTHGSFYESTHASELRSIGYPFRIQEFVAKSLFDRAVTAQILGRVDIVFTLSDTESSDVARRFPTTSKSLFALPNFLDTSPTPRTTVGGEREDAFRAQYGPYVCAVARIDARKNFEAAVRAVQGLDVSFLLAGTDSGDMGRLLRLKKVEGIENFHYLGPVDTSTRNALVRGAVATVLPSYFEGFPFSVLDSLREGVPAICTRRSYMPPLEGVVFCEPDPSSVRRAITSVRERRPTVNAHMLPRDVGVCAQVEGILSSMSPK